MIIIYLYAIMYVYVCIELFDFFQFHLDSSANWAVLELSLCFNVLLLKICINLVRFSVAYRELKHHLRI